MADVRKRILARAGDIASDVSMVAADWVMSHVPVNAVRAPHHPPARLVAHRGAWKERGCLENTFAAFDRARESGVWGIEFDVRFTKDDVPVVHHDASLLRTFGRPLLLESMTLRTLRHEAAVIPTLEEVVEEYKDSVHLMIELKGNRSDWTDARMQKIMNLTAPMKAVDQFHFMAIDMDVLEAMQSRVGALKRSLVSISASPATAAPVSKATIEHDYGAFTSHWLTTTGSILEQHRAVGQAVGVGFAASPASLRREWARGIDWIFTNHGHVAPQWLDELER